MKPAILYKKLDKGIVQCDACNHFCKINEGKVGVCGVRQNIHSELNLLVYGKTISVNVDPVEKKPLFHFLPGEFAFSIGTLGCNFRCLNCHNFDISQMFENKGNINSYNRIYWGMDFSPERIVDEAIKNKCSSIAYTYNEPTVFTEYALDTMKLAKKRNIKNIWVSNGFMSNDTLDLIIPYLDGMNIDIKSFDERFYLSNCGGRLQPVLNNCKKLVKEGVWLEITTLIIPTLSDDLKMLESIAKFIKDELGDFVPWHLSAFSGAISWKLDHIPSTGEDVIKKTYDIGKKIGLKFIYVGNIWDTDLESSYCPECNIRLIKRVGYKVELENIKGGYCTKCKTKIPGIWK